MTSRRNMYDCTPCPECGAEYRAAYGAKHPKHPNSVVCDDCGDIEPIDGNNYDPTRGEDDEDTP